MTNWKELARQTGVPTFPVHISHNGVKWEKEPLTKHGHLDATTDVDRLNWGKANAVGIPMGKTLYALDVDSWDPECRADEWLSEWNLPETRVHQTVSGGTHMLYKLPPDHYALPSRRGIVPGLDARGLGGWIAFGEGYKVIDPRPAVLLPEAVCNEIWRGWHGGGGSLDLPEPEEVDEAAVANKLDTALSMNSRLALRWQDYKEHLHDLSRSGKDLSAAAHLVRSGFTYSEVVWLLEHKFPHGTSLAPGNPKKNLQRELRRCAARAIKGLEKKREQMAQVVPGKATISAHQRDTIKEMF